jgi:hypothetical protein
MYVHLTLHASMWEDANMTPFLQKAALRLSRGKNMTKAMDV